MAKETPSMAKNKMKRCLISIYDPHPSHFEVEALWDYFESSCAYCGNYIERKSRNGHLDHLVSSSERGGNNIYNFALSCARCNGDEKREEAWKSFLHKKVSEQDLYEKRAKKIEDWLSLSPGFNLSEDFLTNAETIVGQALEDFDRAVAKMRELKSKSV